MSPGSSSTDLNLRVYDGRAVEYPSDTSTGMDERTERLRDLFVDVTGGTTATERQAESRGSLPAGVDREGLRDVIAEMRERYGFDSGLGDAALVRVVVGTLDGERDATMASSLGVEPEVVFRARADLHLLRPAETEPAWLDRLPDLLGTRPVEAVADEIGVDSGTVERGRRVADALAQIEASDGRYRSALEARVDGPTTERLTEAVGEHGLESATEDAESESDVSL
jgi:hypothetical protein